MDNTITPEYYSLVDFYDNCFTKYGPTPKGVDWPNELDLLKRFDVMLQVIKNQTPTPTSLLDLGCGYGALLDYLINNNKNQQIDYEGIDLSENMILEAKNRHPAAKFYIHDILKNLIPANSFDYIVMNGVLTERQNLSQTQMIEFAQTLIKEAFKICRYGIAFNVMSIHVDWLGEKLFHWGFDEIAKFLKNNCSRNIVFRSDYGLYEFTTYVYK